MCEQIAKQGIAACGWSTKAHDAACIFSTAMMSALLHENGQPPSLAAAFEQGQKAILSEHRRAAGSTLSDRFVLETPHDSTVPLAGGAIVAGVPLLLAPLPASKLHGLPGRLDAALHEQREEVHRELRRRLGGGGGDAALSLTAIGVVVPLVSGRQQPPSAST